MTLRVIRKSSAAERDIDDIAAHIAADNPTAAEQFGEELVEKLEYLREFPRTGHPVEGFEVELLMTGISHRFRRYLIVYRLPDDDTLTVVRVLHGARDVATELSKSK